jgi:predicted  nucleic acid-binding Zn-ribbon protein
LQEKLKALTELQRVDLDIAALRKSSEAYPRQTADLEKELSSSRSEVDAERERLADIDRQRRTLEQSIADEKDKVKKWEARLAEQRSPREYAALAREIDIAKKSNQTMAEQLVELGKMQAAGRETVKAKEQQHAELQQKIGGKITELKTKMDGLSGQIAELDALRKKASTGVDARLLQRYDAVRKRRLPALVPVRAGTCQGCNMNVPPQLYNTLCTTMSTDICPSCHRIIYAAETLEPPAAKQ